MCTHACDGQACRTDCKGALCRRASLPCKGDVLTFRVGSGSVFVNGLRQLFPGILILSEETEPDPLVLDMSPLEPLEMDEDPWLDLKDLLITVDPLDATKEFTENLVHYVTTMVGARVHRDHLSSRAGFSGALDSRGTTLAFLDPCSAGVLLIRSLVHVTCCPIGWQVCVVHKGRPIAGVINEPFMRGQGAIWGVTLDSGYKVGKNNNPQ